MEPSKFMEGKKTNQQHKRLYHLLRKKCLNYKLMGTIAIYLPVRIPYRSMPEKSHQAKQVFC